MLLCCGDWVNLARLVVHYRVVLHYSVDGVGVRERTADTGSTLGGGGSAS